MDAGLEEGDLVEVGGEEEEFGLEPGEFEGLAAEGREVEPGEGFEGGLGGGLGEGGLDAAAALDLEGAGPGRRGGVGGREAAAGLAGADVLGASAGPGAAGVGGDGDGDRVGGGEEGVDARVEDPRGLEEVEDSPGEDGEAPTMAHGGREDTV
jgi:hypothetical protein